MVGVGHGRRKAGELKFVGKCHDVVENEWCKNVRLWPCHDVDENKQHTVALPRYH
jgi:hypothetical protein